MGTAAAVIAVLELLGLANKESTKDLIRTVYGMGESIVKGIIKNKKEPTDQEAAAMKAALKAGRDAWPGVLDDWN